jgi:hypothetical protein
MDRRVYFSVVILVVMTIRQNRPDSVSARKVKEMFGISRKTLKRWIAYFKEEFPYSKKWRRLRGSIDSSVTNDDLPSRLVNYFLNSFKSKELVILAGNGHVRHKYGIPTRLYRRNNEPFKVVVQDEEIEDSIADYVLLTTELKGKKAPKLGVIVEEKDQDLVVLGVEHKSPAKKSQKSDRV